MLAIWKKSGNFWKSPGPRAAPAAPAVAPVVERQSWPNGQVGAGLSWGIPKSPWVSRLSHGPMTWMIWVPQFQETSGLEPPEKWCSDTLIKHHILKLDGDFQSLLSFEEYWGP